MNPGLSSAIPWPSSSESVSEAEAAGRSDLRDRCVNAGLCHGPTCAGVGGLMTYGSSDFHMYQRAATFVDKTTAASRSLRNLCAS